MQEHHANLLFPSFILRMKIEMAKHAVMILNNLPTKSRLSNTYRPWKMMTGKTLDRKKICKLSLGAYAQVHEDINITNTKRERT